MPGNGSPMASEVAETCPRPAQSALVAEGPTASRPAVPSPKPRSCVVCRARKVRCDKQSPCSNCRRANIPCVLPSTNRPPRWAKNFNAATGELSAQHPDSATAHLMDRLRNLESLVKDLRGQLDQAQAGATTSTGGSPADSNMGRDDRLASDSPTPSSASKLRAQFGRLVINDASRSRYVSNGFWSRVTDELDEIRMETHDLANADYESSEDDEGPDASPMSHDLHQTPQERPGFLFRNLDSLGLSLADLHPLPSQVPFLLDVFAENVNIITQIVHMPTIRKLTRPERGAEAVPLTPANEALMFSIYYAAVTSMEEDDVARNFRTTQAELSSKYRIGLEHALSKADILCTLDITLLQAFTIYLFLVRRHGNPRFVWMMVSLAVRMAQGLGLHRDGSHFKHLTPYEVEIRRRVWYAICALDVRASEDQGTEFLIQYGTFDTELPANINDDDFGVDTKEPPKEREGLTDATTSIVTLEISEITRQMMLPGNSLEEQRRIIQKICGVLETRYLRFANEPQGIVYRGLVIVTRVIVSKLTLLAHLPVLFSSPSEELSDDLRNELFVSALRVAELHHSLNGDRSFRQWRWICQTFTQWHAVIYLLLDMARRNWSPLVERAWIAMHTYWLVPTHGKLDKDMRTWLPLRQLMLKARTHRDAEIERLRRDPAAARQLEIDDQNIPVAWNWAAIADDNHVDVSRDRWRSLVGLSSQDQASIPLDKPIQMAPGVANVTQMPGQPYLNPHHATGSSNMASQPVYPLSAGHIQNPATRFESQAETYIPLPAYDTMMLGESGGLAFDNETYSSPPVGWSDGRPATSEQAAWLWGEADPNMDAYAGLEMNLQDSNVEVNGTMDWNNWVQFAAGMERNARANR